MDRDVSLTRQSLLVREFAEVRQELPQLLRLQDYGRMVDVLNGLNLLAETAGYREICLKSQSVLDLIGRRGGGRDFPGERLLELMDLLLGVLAHIEWRESEGISNWENPAPHDSGLFVGRGVAQPG